MDFLKAILGDELYKQFETAINAYNGNEANKDKPVKIGNLGSGEYVGKGKYDALQTLLDGKTTELNSANDLIAELKKGTQNNEDLQGKITTYETQVQQLQEQLAKERLDNAIKLELLTAKALDVDYMTFKLKEKGELTLDENGKIKGWDDKLSSLKTQFPNQFEGSGKKQIIPNILETGDDGNITVTKEQFKGMSYEERINLKKTNEELYKQYSKN